MRGTLAYVTALRADDVSARTNSVWCLSAWAMRATMPMKHAKHIPATPPVAFDTKSHDPRARIHPRTTKVVIIWP